MSKNIFKIYDGRTNFWQWDTGQKLIVLDESVTEVHFSNRNMEHSKKKPVYIDKDGIRVCNIPDLLLQLPKNLVAYAYVKSDDGSGRTIKSVKFAVIQRPIPSDYVCGQDDVIDDIAARLELLEALLKDVEAGKQELIRFNNIVDAAKWAIEEGQPGTIIVVQIDSKWIAHVVENDHSLSQICDCNGNAVVVDLIDGGDGDGYTEEEIIQHWDGGNAAGY